MRELELLAPAKNLECGIAAIDHGADAVYIGAQRFGARAAAGNSVEDIAALCRYAHQFEAKVYVTVNTIIYDEELEDTWRLLQDLQEVNVDAILVQDMGILRGIPPLSSLLSPLSSLHSSLCCHASTQTDNRTVEKVRWLRSIGFRRVVLARELSLDEIAAIHQAVPDIELEVFVHGALCVSYSGLCYASQYCFGRSANRGECAQFCRMKFNLEDANGQVIEQDRHLLSLRDMCRINALEELMEAGVTSFKIEGRLKDIAYVKNVTAAYSQRLNALIAKHPDKYRRASAGHCEYTFTPNLNKTFNRGFTSYFLHGRKPDIFSPDTPKALGEYVGKVKEIRGNSFNVAGTASFANGDGLCFFKQEGGRNREERNVLPGGNVRSGRSMILEGFRINRAEGNRLYPFKMPAGLKPGMALYRNNDQVFERLMAGKTATRKIPVQMILRQVEQGVELTMSRTDHTDRSFTAFLSTDHQEAQKPQRENIVRQLTKLGDTPYSCTTVLLDPVSFNEFIPSSKLAELRRIGVAGLSSVWRAETSPSEGDSTALFPVPSSQLEQTFPYLYNIANHEAKAFYEQHGLTNPAPAFEIAPVDSPILMQCRHCLRYSLGYCVRHGGKQPRWKEPLSLVLGDGRRFRLEFLCSQCQMNVYGEMKDER